MWQSSYSYDDSQTFAYGHQSSGSSGFGGQCENSAPQNGAPQQDDFPQHGDFPQQDVQPDVQPGGYLTDDFQPQDSNYGEHYQTQEFYYYHSEHHVDSSAFQA
ncbi:hypothetical protein FB565_004386 [Actinoplanes lutulentus]|uniref:Uncharacterized protein n=1 Tax=Actinoplanes lutulentus TaxID=1287878 RepID=A0A327Z2K2_9ACTN|nr:hypothetical protein [Actinoplanes lutulentus]MBB2944653.1 hypothetical protein [Actinoplanes lutulentus]RAK27140.1 hypothetical protein B0I29_12427 [Actinoplanes lutulentus]